MEGKRIFRLCFLISSCMSIVQALLHFIYKDDLIEDEELSASSSTSVISVFDTLTAKLLEAADRYDLPRLRLMCEAVLCKDISVSSVAKILALADRYHAMDLKSVCLKFSAENLVGMFLFYFSFSRFLYRTVWTLLDTNCKNDVFLNFCCSCD